jgi:hypothetical protein
VTRRSLLLRGAMLAAGLAGSAAWLISQSPGPSIPADETLLRAMRDELERSKQLAVVAGQDAPYFFSYTLTDAESLRISAAMGAVVTVARTRFRSPVTEVRVGSYDFDNTGHVFSGISSGSRYDGPWTTIIPVSGTNYGSALTGSSRPPWNPWHASGLRSTTRLPPPQNRCPISPRSPRW